MKNTLENTTPDYTTTPWFDVEEREEKTAPGPCPRCSGPLIFSERPPCPGVLDLVEPDQGLGRRPTDRPPSAGPRCLPFTGSYQSEEEEIVVPEPTEPTCAVCGWTGPRDQREINANEITGRLECQRCFYTRSAAEAEQAIAQGLAEAW